MDSKQSTTGRFWRWAPGASSPAAPTDSGTVPPAGPPPAGRLESLAILIVDDHAANADSLRELLRLEGAVVSTCSRADEALRRLAAEHCDVVISDLAMPGMSGNDLVAAMRAGGRNACAAAIAYSGFGGVEHCAAAIDAGFDAHLTKPSTLDAFVAAILRARAERAARGKPGEEAPRFPRDA